MVFHFLSNFPPKSGAFYLTAGWFTVTVHPFIPGPTDDFELRQQKSSGIQQNTDPCVLFCLFFSFFGHSPDLYV